MSKGNILIAEDDPVLRNLYVKKLTMEGFAVRTTEDGDETIKAITAEKPDLVLCDIHMPKADGFQVLEAFPKATRSFPIIMLTNLEGDFRERANNLGADDYFVKKDMTIRSLMEMVNKLLHL